jgi:hypothetical protein
MHVASEVQGAHAGLAKPTRRDAFGARLSETKSVHPAGWRLGQDSTSPLRLFQIFDIPI